MTAVKFLLKEEVDEINSEEHLEAPADPEGTGQSREEGEETGLAGGGRRAGELGRGDGPRG